MTTYTSKELTRDQKSGFRKMLFLMDSGLGLPPIDNRPDAGPLTSTLDQLCEAYHDAGQEGFRKTVKALSVDQPILLELYAANRKYRQVSVRELLDMPEQEWIIKNFLYEDAVSVLYGWPGCGKSFIALDWACHLALGIDWLGRKVEQCRVIYIATEGIRGYRRRVRAWCKHHGYEPEALFKMLVFIPCAVPLGNSAEVDDFIFMQQVSLESYDDGFPTFIILDTVFQCAAGMNINQTEVATGLIETVQDIRKSLNAIHALLVHHSGKDKERGMSGNMAFKASTDLSYLVERDRDGEITVTADKVKDDENVKTWLRLEKVFYGDGERDNSCVIVAADPPLAAEQLVLIEKRMLEVLPVAGGLNFTDWMKAASIPKSTFARYRDDLVKKGFVRNIGTETRPVYIRAEQETDGSNEDEK